MISRPLWPNARQCPISALHQAHSCDSGTEGAARRLYGRRFAAMTVLGEFQCRHPGRPKAGDRKPIVQVPDYPDKAALADVEAKLATFPPLVFAGEARQLKKAFGRVAARRWLPAPGRRLRRELPRAPRRQHPRLLPRLPADGGRADLCRRLAGGEGRPHRRPVRQAALLADGEEGRHRAAELSRRHHQRAGVHARGAHSRSAAPARGLPPVGGDAEPDPRLRATAAMPTSSACISGRWASSRTARRAIATRSSPTASPRRWASCAPAASPRRTRRSSARRTSTRATRRCCSATSRR